MSRGGNPPAPERLVPDRAPGPPELRRFVVEPEAAGTRAPQSESLLRRSRYYGFSLANLVEAIH